jgi:hypothetical protein
MSNHQDPAGEDMDAMNKVKDEVNHELEIINQAFRMTDPKDAFGQMYRPTIEHVKVLVREIQHLREQIKMGVACGDIKIDRPY